MRYPEVEGEFAGIMDASGCRPDGAPSHWSEYWHVDDVDAIVARATGVGGRVVMEATDTAYGRLATLTDPGGAECKVRTPPS